MCVCVCVCVICVHVRRGGIKLYFTGDPGTFELEGAFEALRVRKTVLIRTEPTPPAAVNNWVILLGQSAPDGFRL